ncbi:hypothetical protein AOB46_10830 [Chryseobacterium indologenes]|uniref:Uncharacterized protein n=1 Tax=Chryseobacterium indologenes TaxID=253 RepID=A0A0N0ZUI5_CHRID|nr:hypothetical protein AOB46_10830 [Chryseobacterium indologenes]
MNFHRESFIIIVFSHTSICTLEIPGLQTIKIPNKKASRLGGFNIFSLENYSNKVNGLSK